MLLINFKEKNSNLMGEIFVEILKVSVLELIWVVRRYIKGI